MKKEKLFRVLAALIALGSVAAAVAGQVSLLGGGFWGMLSLPFTAAGWVLRRLSLSGAAGNAAAIVLYVLLCAVPLVLWWRSRRRMEDGLLLLLPLELALVLYYMVNPNLRPTMMQNSVGDAVYAAAIWSTGVTWGVLKLLYSEEWCLERNIYQALRVFLLLCAVSCLVECFGTGTARIVNALQTRRQLMGAFSYIGTELAFLILAYLAAAVEYCFAALVLYRGAQLLRELELDPFGSDCVAQASAVSRLCRNGLTIICLTGLLLNLAQILLTPLMRNISVSVTVPVSGLAVCFAMLAVTKLLVRGKELKDDNDLFV